MDYTINAAPRISAATFAAILTAAHSPAAPSAAQCFNACVLAGVDPAVALAFFQHESGYGLNGRAVVNRSWGNLRWVPSSRYPANDGFVQYPSFAAGCADFCRLLLGPVYAGSGLRTVSQVVPTYAPASDNNVPAAYISKVNAFVTLWSAAPVDPWASWGDAFPLDPAQRGYAIPQAWLANRAALGEATSDELHVNGYALRSFARGYIVWCAADNTAHVHLYGAD
jgi:hypothetical protein